MLQLHVFNPTDDYDDDSPPPSLLRVRDYLVRLPLWTPDLAKTMLLLDPAAGISLLPINTFGWLDAIAAQLFEAADRLAAGEPALIRSSYESIPMYLALEPGADATYLSVLGQLPREVEYWPLPAGNITGPVDHRAELHAFVAAHRDELRPGGALSERMMPSARCLQNIRLADSAMVSALRAEATDGFRLYKTLRPKALIP
jgi:hypothetical protein